MVGHKENVSNVKKNSKLGSIDETIEEDEEEEERLMPFKPGAYRYMNL